MMRVTRQPSTNATTSGPMPSAAAASDAACSCARSIPRSSVSFPPILRTNASPPTTTLKLWFVIPPPSGSTTGSARGQSRASAACRSMRDPRLTTRKATQHSGPTHLGLSLSLVGRQPRGVAPTISATILVLEANAAVLELIDQMLRESGHRVLSTNNGLEAVEVLRRVHV